MKGLRRSTPATSESGRYVPFSERAAERVRLPLALGDLAGAAEVAHRLADAAHARAQEGTAEPLPACTGGCAFCCHVHVDTTRPELVAIAPHLRKRLAPAELAVFRATLSAHVARADALSDDGRWAARIPCALLDDEGRCSVYAVRPLRCRAFHSTSREACHGAFEGTSEEPAPTNHAIARAVQVVESAYAQAFENAGVTLAVVRLERGLLEVL